jgi:hypothetical protein
MDLLVKSYSQGSFSWHDMSYYMLQMTCMHNDYIDKGKWTTKHVEPTLWGYNKPT